MRTVTSEKTRKAIRYIRRLTFYYGFACMSARPTVHRTRGLTHSLLIPAECDESIDERHGSSTDCVRRYTRRRSRD